MSNFWKNSKFTQWVLCEYIDKKLSKNSKLTPWVIPPLPPVSSLLNVVDNSDAQSDSPVFAYFDAPKNFLMDSSATNHMTPFGSNFKCNSYFSLINSNQLVTLGDGTTWLRTLGKGTIEQWVKTRPHQHRLPVLVNVLHVESIKQCFLSTPWLLEKGFAVNFTEGKVEATKGDFTIKGFRTGHLFQCPIYTDKLLSSNSLCWAGASIFYILQQYSNLTS